MLTLLMKPFQMTQIDDVMTLAFIKKTAILDFVAARGISVSQNILFSYGVTSFKIMH